MQTVTRIIKSLIDKHTRTMPNDCNGYRTDVIVNVLKNKTKKTTKTKKLL